MFVGVGDQAKFLAFLHNTGNVHNTVSKSQSLSIKVRT